MHFTIINFNHASRLYEMMEKNYLRMLENLPDTDKDPWVLYILLCSDGKLYTGITNDIERRFQMHATGKAARFTRSRLPVKLVYCEECAGRSAALRREAAVKKLPRSGKDKLIAGYQPSSRETPRR